MSVRVLVVDANSTTSRQIAEQLGLDGVDAQVASTADEALRQLNRSSFQVLFTELALPGRSGLEVLAFAQAHEPELAAVALGESVSAESVVEAMRLGACDFLFKPITTQKLRLSFSRALQVRSRHLKMRDTDVLASVAPRGDQSPAPLDQGQCVMVPLLCDYRRIEKHLVKATVLLFNGNKTAAAKSLGMHRRTLYRVLERVDQ
jgi:DNA-binding NtrC family response regulator